MLDILKNFNSAENGEKTSASANSTNEMKTILESFSKVSETEQSVAECGEMEMPQAQPQSQGQPVTVSITASGKENVDELMAILKGAGINQPAAAPASSMPDQEMDMAAMRKAIMMPAEEEIEEEDYINEPDEEYKDHNFMTKDLSGGINRQKKHYKAAQRGDNAMAVESIKDKLWAALSEKKANEGKYKNNAQRKAVHAAKAKEKK